jgi:sugar/nucleoside kinase (ribokinase family)
MLTEPPSYGLDLVVVGGLTIDRFADGSSAPGGSAIHITRAAAPRGLRISVVTAVGPEAIAQRGLIELQRLAGASQVTAGAATTTFLHEEVAGGRQLTLERRGADLDRTAGVLGRGAFGGATAPAILFAPVAGEIEAQALGWWGDKPRRAAILQGWLRTIAPGLPVRPLPLDTMGPALTQALSRLDLVVASREDLLAEDNDPVTQLLAMRAALGDGPALVVTDGPNGLWLITDSSPVHIAVPWRVDVDATVGAGDILAAFMLALLADGHDPAAAAAGAMKIVAQELDSRKVG